MLWKILLAVVVAALLGLELAGRAVSPEPPLGMLALFNLAESEGVSSLFYVILFGVMLVVVAAGLYVSLSAPLRLLARSITNVHRASVNTSLPCQGARGALGALADAVAELMEKQRQELGGLVDAGQQTKRRLRELEAQVAEQGAELDYLRERSAALEMVDEATGLPNRSAFDGRLQAELLRIQRNGTPLSVALFQVAQFGAVAARVGREQADRVMMGIGEIVTKAVRATDFAARYSDDAIVLMLPETPAKNASMVVEDIHRLLSSNEYSLPRGLAKLKVGGGLASTDAKPDALDSIPERLALAVSRSLDEGGVRVEVA